MVKLHCMSKVFQTWVNKNMSNYNKPWIRSDILSCKGGKRAADPSVVSVLLPIHEATPAFTSEYANDLKEV